MKSFSHKWQTAKRSVVRDTIFSKGHLDTESFSDM